MKTETSIFATGTLEKTFDNDQLKEMRFTSYRIFSKQEIEFFTWEVMNYTHEDIPLITCDRITEMYIDIDEHVLILTINKRILIEIEY